MARIDAVPGLAELRRTRDAVRHIKGLPLENKVKKDLLTEWFDDHPRAGINLRDVRNLLNQGIGFDEANRILRRIGRHEQYNQLLGREANQRLIG